jgi:uncharacterized protein (DUF39 family)
MPLKTIDEINEKISEGKAVVVTAEEMIDIVRDNGPKKAAKMVDVVTTGTFSPMCSSGAFINFGHSSPAIRMTRVWLNDVMAYAGIAAVDAYIGATELSESQGMATEARTSFRNSLKAKISVFVPKAMEPTATPEKA